MVYYRPIYTLEEAAKELCISEDQLDELLRQRHLPGIIVADVLLIRGKDLESYINTRSPWLI